jgi:hypothetical protein
VGEFYGRESLSELDEFKDPAPASIGSFSVLSSLEYGEANDFGVPETANELVNSFAADLRKIAELNASVAAMGRVSHDET